MKTVHLEGEVIVKRNPDAGGHTLSILKDMFVERGSIEDWHQLQALHYKSQSIGMGTYFFRCAVDDGTERGHTIGCMGFSFPRPNDSGRNAVLRHMRANQQGRDTKYMNTYRANWMNKNLTLSSRTVVDTMYRGAGIAYRFKNLAYRMTGFRFVESRSSMSRFNPFSIKAGMKFLPPKKAAAYDKGIRFFNRWFDAPPYDTDAILKEIKNMPEAIQKKCIQELRTFYWKHSPMEKSGDKRDIGMTRVNALSLEYVLKQTQQLVLGRTVYAFWENPDMQHVAEDRFRLNPDIPKRIPLLAFDNQGPNEPLDLEALQRLQN